MTVSESIPSPRGSAKTPNHGTRSRPPANEDQDDLLALVHTIAGGGCPE